MPFFVKSEMLDQDQTTPILHLLHSHLAYGIGRNAVLQTALKPLVVKGKSLLPIVQGGMGVGVSAHRLAGNVAALGGIGTISSVDLRRHHPDLMAQTGKSRNKALID